MAEAETETDQLRIWFDARADETKDWYPILGWAVTMNGNWLRYFVNKEDMRGGVYIETYEPTEQQLETYNNLMKKLKEEKEENVN